MYGHACSSQRCITHAAPTLQQAAANAGRRLAAEQELHLLGCSSKVELISACATQATNQLQGRITP